MLSRPAEAIIMIHTPDKEEIRNSLVSINKFQISKGFIISKNNIGKTLISKVRTTRDSTRKIDIQISRANTGQVSNMATEWDKAADRGWEGSDSVVCSVLSGQCKRLVHWESRRS